MKWVNWIPGLVAVALWTVFAPGIYSHDGNRYLYDALTGYYGDLSPVINLLYFSTIIKVWCDVGLITLGTCLFTMYGIWYLLRKLFTRGMALCVLCVLLSPLTPLTMLLVSTCKDSWQLGALGWATGCLVALWRRQGYVSTWFLVRASVAMALAAMIRHNSVLLLPVFALSLCLARGWHRWFALAPSVIYLAATILIGYIVPVTREYSIRQVQIMDVAGVCAIKPEAAKDFPEVMRNFAKDYPATFVNGRMDTLYTSNGWNKCNWNYIYAGTTNMNGVHAQYLPSSPITREYHNVFRHWPTLLLVKTQAFLNLYLLRGEPEIRIGRMYEQGVVSAYVTLSENPSFAGTRKTLYAVWSAVLEKSSFRVLAYPPLWNVIGLVALAVMFARRDPFGWVLLPLVAYVFTFAPASILVSYRLLWPSALLLPAALAAWALTVEESV